MIHINNKIKLDMFKKENNFCAIIDFDRTITNAKSTASMGVIPEYVGGNLLEERKKIYNHYRPIELDYSLDAKTRKETLKKWTVDSFEMLCRYIKSKDIIKEALINPNLHLRDGVKDFLKEMKNKNIPVIIMSAGLGNLIKEFIKKESILYDNIYIVSNFLSFKNDEAYIDKTKLISPSNKEYMYLPDDIKKIIEEKNHILLLGDLAEDIKMIDEKLRNKTLAIGFLDKNIEENIDVYNKKFDIVLTNNETFETINELIREEN